MAQCQQDYPLSESGNGESNVVFNATPNPFLLNKICLNQSGSKYWHLVLLASRAPWQTRWRACGCSLLATSRPFASLLREVLVWQGYHKILQIFILSQLFVGLEWQGYDRLLHIIYMHTATSFKPRMHQQSQEMSWICAICKMTFIKRANLTAHLEINPQKYVKEERQS